MTYLAFAISSSVNTVFFREVFPGLLHWILGKKLNGNMLMDVIGQSLSSTGLSRNTTLASLTELLDNASSRYRHGALQGLVIRGESAQGSDARAKLVRPSFTQAINIHWRKRTIKWNKLGFSYQENK